MTEADKITFTVCIKNMGASEGSEATQVYIRDLKSSLPPAVKELKGFEKVSLKVGEEKAVSITVDIATLSYFDTDKHNWVAEAGDFEAMVGSLLTDAGGKVGFQFKQ